MRKSLSPNRAGWSGLLMRGARVWRREGLIELARRILPKVHWRMRVLAQKVWLRRHRQLTAQLIRVEEITFRSPLQIHQASVDIIICVHNALYDIRRCLESVLRHTTLPYSMILVDDGSALETRDYLAEFARKHRVLLVQNEEAKGYTLAANQGLRQSSAKYVVLLNSDTIVTGQWLDRLISCAESDPPIGLVGPLSNTASWQSIPEIDAQGDWASNPLPSGVTIDEMGQMVAAYSARLYPTLPFLNGFCLLIRQEVIRDIGHFDEENFGPGYGEENDYALRARKAGWLAALADDTYIYHAQSRSYSNEKRIELAKHAGISLSKKHGQRALSDGVAVCRSDRVILGIRARSRVMFDRREYLERGKTEFAGRCVLFVLPITAPAGGANVVLREVKAMQEMGVEVAVFNLQGNRQSFEQSYPDLDATVIYGEEGDILTLASRSDAIVATTNVSVRWLADLVQKDGAPTRGYYIQDFEPYLYDRDTPAFRRATASYTLFPDIVRFTKTEWTQREVERKIGVPSTLVGVSLDIDLFRPRRFSDSRWPDRPLRIAAMVRPATPYREPRLTMDLLQAVSRKFPEVEVVIFGTSLNDPLFAELPHEFPWKLAGVLTQKQMARLLNEVDIFADFSSHQAMGLTALEAMACGVATIVPRRGGAVSFARDGSNSLVVDTSSRDECWRALSRLIKDHDLREHLQTNAVMDVCGFFPERAAYNILHTLLTQPKTRTA